MNDELDNYINRDSDAMRVIKGFMNKVKKSEINFKFGSVPVEIRYKNVISYYAEYNNLTIASIKNQGCVLINNQHEEIIATATNRQYPVFGVSFEFQAKGAVKGLFDYYEQDIKHVPLLASCSYVNDRMIRFLNRQGFKLFLADHKLKAASFCKNIDLPFALNAEKYAQDDYFGSISQNLANAFITVDADLNQPVASRQFSNTDRALNRGIIKTMMDEIEKDPSKEQKWINFHNKDSKKIQDKINNALKAQTRKFKDKKLNESNILDYLQTK